MDLPSGSRHTLSSKGRGRLAFRILTRFCVCLVICGDISAEEVALAAIPHPDLDIYEKGTRLVLEQAISNLSTPANTAVPHRLSRAYGYLGGLYLNLELPKAAEACYHNAIALDPAEFRWPYYLGYLLEKYQRPEAAYKAWLDAFTLNPAYVPLQIRLAQMDVEQGRDDAAKQRLLNVLDAAPSTPAALAALGDLKMAEGEFSAAAENYEEALRLQPAADELHYRLALAYQKTSDTEGARRHIKLRGTIEPSIDDPIISDLAALKPRSSRSYLEAGDAAVRQGNMSAAQRFFETALELNPDNAEAHEKLARLHFRERDYEKARERFQQALNIDPDLPVSNYLIGLLYERSGNLRESEQHYLHALNGDSRSEARLRLASILMRSGRYEEAIGHFVYLADQDPDAAVRWYWLGLANLGAGQCVQAAEPLEKGHAIKSGSGEIIEALVRIYATCVTPSGEQKAWALKSAQLLYNTRRDISHAETLAMVLASYGRYSDAEELLLQVTFEAYRANDAVQISQIEQNIGRFREQETAPQPWLPGHPKFSPPLDAWSGIE